jgi:hypothetical protein
MGREFSCQKFFLPSSVAACGSQEANAARRAGLFDKNRQLGLGNMVLNSMVHANSTHTANRRSNVIPVFRSRERANFFSLLRFVDRCTGLRRKSELPGLR